MFIGIYPHRQVGEELTHTKIENRKNLGVITAQDAIPEHTSQHRLQWDTSIIAKLNFRESCRTAFKNLQLLILPSLYILETSLFCWSKCALIRGRDIHGYETRCRDNYRTGRHRTVVYEHLPSQAGIHFINSFPNFKNAQSSPQPCEKQLIRQLCKIKLSQGISQLVPIGGGGFWGAKTIDTLPLLSQSTAPYAAIQSRTIIAFVDSVDCVTVSTLCTCTVDCVCKTTRAPAYTLLTVQQELI
ncbi:hypothetical protein J6590_024142 [Homalodisca vitripennis]|nr:hypothetical protein J6590_024142 [Homalodisca vitripennis]